VNKVLENIKNRRSIRKYLKDQIKDEDLDMIIEAAIYAPTGGNNQHWHFTIIQNKEIIDYLNVEAKKVMANLPDDWLSLDEISGSAEQVIKMGRSEHLHIFYHAPTVIIISGKEDASTPIPDCSAATQNILLTAESIDIGSCWIGLARFSFENQDNIKKLRIPDGYKPYYAVSLGYKASNKNIAPKRNRNVVNYIK
jgi:nitroreductase